jgi:hypothetical protein
MKRPDSRKQKSPRTKQQTPTAQPASKGRRKPAGKGFELRERGKPGSRIVEFPQMKGRTIRRILFYTSADNHALSIRFADRTRFTLTFEPGFILSSELVRDTKWDEQKIKQWPPFFTTPGNPELEEFVVGRRE